MAKPPIETATAVMIRTRRRTRLYSRIGASGSWAVVYADQHASRRGKLLLHGFRGRWRRRICSARGRNSPIVEGEGKPRQRLRQRHRPAPHAASGNAPAPPPVEVAPRLLVFVVRRSTALQRGEAVRDQRDDLGEQPDRKDHDVQLSEHAAALVADPTRSRSRWC